MKKSEKKQLHFAVVVSMILIFIVLSMLYESFIKPFLIMLTIPLALIGVFWAFVIADYPFDSTAYIGVILLSGIVVNNAIVLVSSMDLLKDRTNNLTLSVINGSYERIRPVFITSSTTIFGMLPLVLFSSKSNIDIWSSLALSTVGGLTTSALLSLVFIPVVYYYLEVLKVKVSGKRNG